MVLWPVVDIWDLPRNEGDAVRFLQHFGILPNNKKCSNGHPMTLYIAREVFWKCNLGQCRQSSRMRVGNWFEGSRIPFTTAVRFIYCWSKEFASTKFCSEQLHMADKTVVDWSCYLRELCIAEMEKEERKKIGGKDYIVEIDIGVLTKRKSVSQELPSQWIFGGICKETNETFLVTLCDRDAATLLHAIKENIKEGTKIYSDCWESYSKSELKIAGYAQYKGKYNFVNPQAGNGKSEKKYVWGAAKWRNKAQRGIAHHLLMAYFAEFIWRQRHIAKGVDSFQAILQAIASQYPPQTKKLIQVSNTDTSLPTELATENNDCNKIAVKTEPEISVDMDTL